jgi:hypothetical protein
MKQLRVYIENIARIIDCVEFKNDPRKKIYREPLETHPEFPEVPYIKSGANNFTEYRDIPKIRLVLGKLPYKPKLFKQQKFSQEIEIRPPSGRLMQQA